MRLCLRESVCVCIFKEIKVGVSVMSMRGSVCVCVSVCIFKEMIKVDGLCVRKSVFSYFSRLNIRSLGTEAHTRFPIEYSVTGHWMMG